MLGSAESKHPRLTNPEINCLKNSNLCDYNTSTSRRDGQTTCRIAIGEISVISDVA